MQIEDSSLVVHTLRKIPDRNLEAVSKKQLECLHTSPENTTKKSELLVQDMTLDTTWLTKYGEKRNKKKSQLKHRY